MKKISKRSNYSNDFLSPMSPHIKFQHLEKLSLKEKCDLHLLESPLSVRQIELEVQLEELHSIRTKLHLSVERYMDIIEQAPIGFFVLSPEGSILESNLEGDRMLGINKQQRKNELFSTYIADEASRNQFARHFEKVLKESSPQHCDLELISKNGSQIFGHLKSKKYETDAGRKQMILTSILDVTHLKKQNEVLEIAQDTLKFLAMDRTNEITKANEKLSQEIEERKNSERDLQEALKEIKQLKNRFQAENIHLRQEIARDDGFAEIIGQSTALTDVFFRIKQVAPQNTTVLLLGETGVGKGVIARAIHNCSARKNQPMITVNCAALPENLIESELFGREKGAFTGSSNRQMGRFELADGGTIFLDEIGEMPIGLQCKLLRVIQDGEFERLGSPRTIKVDVRIIAASNRNLNQEIQAGRFREDLFYRLSVFPVQIPPLRHRKEDIVQLVNYFVARFNKKMGKKIETIAQATLKQLTEYSWPGNVRELESVIERAVVVSEGPSLQVMERLMFPPNNQKSGEKYDLQDLNNLERNHILQVLRATGWRIEGKNGAATILGLNPSTLRSRMRKYEIRKGSQTPLNLIYTPPNGCHP